MLRAASRALGAKSGARHCSIERHDYGCLKKSNRDSLDCLPKAMDEGNILLTFDLMHRAFAELVRHPECPIPEKSWCVWS